MRAPSVPGGGPAPVDGRTPTAVVRRFDDAGTPWQTLNAAVATQSTRLPARPEPAPVAGPETGPVVGANNDWRAGGEMVHDDWSQPWGADPNG